MKAEKIARTIFHGFRGYRRGGWTGAVNDMIFGYNEPIPIQAPYPSAAEYVDEPDFELYCVC